MNERKREREDKELGTIITKMMKAWGLEDKMKEMDIVNAWPELMGNGVAFRTEKITISNGIMQLKLNSSEMREELLFGKAVIIKRVNDFAGYDLIRDVWFT
ncbi:MAG TPA: DUF721 domain-containing protein [Brumimicrobium sp.]|nr:DUF721 domain-containing protein [Brumimicrobium sp.]